MVTILERPREIILGKPAKTDEDYYQGKRVDTSFSLSSQEAKEAIFTKLSKVEHITFKVLEENPVLRLIKFRNLLSKIVSEIYGEELSNETVPRACRRIQNDYGFFKVEDNREELSEIWREYYSK